MNSGVPGAVRAIYDALSVALPSPAMVVVGPSQTDDPADGGLVLVGVDDADETTYAHAVAGSQSWAQLGGMRRDETFVVHCVAVAWNGDSDALSAMDAAYSLMGVVESAIVADPTLGGALLYAVGVTSQGLKFTTDANGVAAHVPFDVECRTRI